MTDFRRLAAKIDALTETVALSKPASPSQPAADTGKLSRRAFLRLGLAPDEQAGEKTETVEVERPLHPAIRFGVSQALLAAVAATQGVTTAELVAEEYGLSMGTAVPIHLQVDDTAVATAMPILTRHVSSLGYTTSRHNPQAVLGDNAKNLQKHARQVKKWISTLEGSYRPTIHLNVGGSLGQLYDNDAGKILGALFGLEMAVAPYPIRIENVVPVEDGDIFAGQFLPTMSQLKTYLQMRGMAAQLAVGAGIDTPQDVDALLDAEAVHMVHLDLRRWGSVEQVISAIQACREKDVAVMLSGGGNGRAARALAHIALAIQPDLVTGPPAPLYNEMAHTLAWLASSRD